MRDLLERPKTRVKGKPALTKSLGGLLIRAQRFARCRATTPADCWWAARVIEALEHAYAVARTHGTDTGMSA